MIEFLGGMGLTAILIAMVFVLKEKIKNETREEKISRIRFTVLGDVLLMISIIGFYLLFRNINTDCIGFLQYIRTGMIPIIVTCQVYAMTIVGLCCFYMRHGSKK